VRQTGVAYNLEEATAGICTQAIAIRGSTGALLAISVPVPTQRYWAIEDKITRVLLDVRKEALAALDPPSPTDSGHMSRIKESVSRTVK